MIKKEDNNTIRFTKTHKIIQSREGDVTLLKSTEHEYEPLLVIEKPAPGIMDFEELLGYGEGLADLLKMLPDDIVKQIGEKSDNS